MQTSDTLIQTETVAVRRSIIASALLGMGLTEESLQCDSEQVTYTGLEKRYLILRWSKVTKLVKLQDVDGIHEMKTMHPLFLVFAFLAFLNFLANLRILPQFGGSWWDLEIWRLPYLWLGSFIVTSSTNQGPINFIAVLFWLALAYFFKRNFLFLDAGHLSEIRLRTDGIPPAEFTAFKKELHARWSIAKRCKIQEKV